MSTLNLGQPAIVATVTVENKKVAFVSLTLDQQMGEHHHFSVTLDYDATGKAFLSSPEEQIHLIGKPLHIELKQGAEESYLFKGVVTHTINEGREGRHGYLIIEGSSPTILLERGKRWDVFDNMTLTEVCAEVCDGHQNQHNLLKLSGKPTHQSKLPFLMQYGESDWQFLRRLSALSKENLYYNGAELVFGAAQELPTMKVTYDKELTNIQFGTRLAANTFSHYHYLPEQDATLEQDAPQRIDNGGKLLDDTFKASADMIHQRPVRTPAGLPVDNQADLSELTAREKVSNAAETLYVKGNAKTCHPRIGRLLQISIPSTLSQTSDLGTYRVIRVRHSIDESNRYECSFDAVTAGLKFYPSPRLTLPQAAPVVAKVVSNRDPRGQGRVWVEFPFAKERRTEVWLRVMTPNGGSSGNAKYNRGLVFVPNPDDQVMVGFEWGDPNRPYVMGSLFHGKNGKGGGKNNHIKSITTDSGHTIIFDDASDSRGITIKDKHHNRIHFDTNSRNIEISTFGTIQLNAMDIHLNAMNDLTLMSGNNTDQTIGGEHAVHIQKSQTVQMGEGLELAVGKSANINVQEDLEKVIGGSFKQTVKKDVETTASGAFKLLSDGEMSVKGSDGVSIAQ